MASIRKTAAGAWNAQVSKMGVRKSGTFDTKAEADTWAAIEESKIREQSALKRKFSVHPKANMLLSLDQILAISSPSPNTSGIYFLINDGVISYIGQSKNVMNRLGRHDQNGREFTHYAFIPCGIEDLDEKEHEYISAYKPKSNRETMKKVRAEYGIGRSEQASAP